MTWQTSELSQRDYDQVVITYDYVLSTLVKVEILTELQFAVLLDKLKVAGMDDDDYQLVTTCFRAMRRGD